jgi:hypothetical protein
VGTAADRPERRGMRMKVSSSRDRSAFNGLSAGTNALRSIPWVLAALRLAETAERLQDRSLAAHCERVAEYAHHKSSLLARGVL